MTGPSRKARECLDGLVQMQRYARGRGMPPTHEQARLVLHLIDNHCDTICDLQAAAQASREDEREKCAKVCDDFAGHNPRRCAHEIRRRGGSDA